MVYAKPIYPPLQMTFSIKKAIQNLDGFSFILLKAYLMISRKPKPLMIAR